VFCILRVNSCICVHKCSGLPLNLVFKGAVATKVPCTVNVAFTFVE